MMRYLHPNWRDELRDNKFPFADGASLTSASGLVLGNDTFLDGHLYPIGNDGQLYISKIDVTSSRVTIYIGTPNARELASADFSPLAAPETLEFSDTLGRPAGVLISDELGLSVAQSWPVGSHAFTDDATPFVSAVCTPMPEVGFRGFQLESGELVTGDIWLVGENGVVIRNDPDESLPNGHIIRIDFVGDPLFVRRKCANVVSDSDVPLFTPHKFLKTLNNISPDEFGNVRIFVGTGTVEDPTLRISPTPNGLVWSLIGQKTGD